MRKEPRKSYCNLFLLFQVGGEGGQRRGEDNEFVSKRGKERQEDN